MGAILSALLLILSYPPFDLGWLALVALIPWLRWLRTVPTLRAAWRDGYGLGLLVFGGTIWWLVHVTVVGTLLLVAYLALYVAAFSAAAAWCLRRLDGRSPLVTTLVLSSVWTLLEYVRGSVFSGFGWNLLAHTQWRSPLLQTADLVGVYGVSWLVVFINVGVWQAWPHHLPQAQRAGPLDLPPLAGRQVVGWRHRSLRPATAVAVVLALTVGYGTVRRAVVERAAEQGKRVRVALVQGNIPQDQKWDVDYVELITTRYEALTRQAARDGAAFILWPETAVPGLANEAEHLLWLETLSRAAQAPLLVGAPWGTWDPTGQLFNSALLVTPDGWLVDRYDKLHLVPFGEFIPGESWLPALGRLRARLPIGRFTPGARETVFRVPTAPPIRLSVLICFEDLFPAISRAMVRRGAQVLATITNDAWFGRTAAPIQHAQASVFRAVEHRVWMLRAANTGFSCAIDPLGRIVAAVQGPDGPLGVSGIRVVPMAVASAGPTMYTRWGDWWLLPCALLVLLPLIPLPTSFRA